MTAKKKQKKQVRELSGDEGVEQFAFDPNEFLVDPTDFDPRLAAFGTPIGFPDPDKDYPTEGTVYPDPTP